MNWLRSSGRVAVAEEIKAPFLSYEQIRRAADAFLTRHHRSRKLPIPIEEIIELQLAIHIVPLPGLQETFGIEAFTTSDRREIYVDNFVCTRRFRRYRFSLAHEVGHMSLHQDLYDAARFRSVKEWKRFITEFPAEEYTWFEYQAYSFAGLVLVPSRDLALHAERAARTALRHRIDLHDDVAWEYIADHISDAFAVSKDVIQRRLIKDGIRNVAWLKDRGLMR